MKRPVLTNHNPALFRPHAEPGGMSPMPSLGESHTSQLRKEASAQKAAASAADPHSTQGYYDALAVAHAMQKQQGGKGGHRGKQQATPKGDVVLMIVLVVILIIALAVGAV